MAGQVNAKMLKKKKNPETLWKVYRLAGSLLLLGIHKTSIAGNNVHWAGWGWGYLIFQNFEGHQVAKYRVD